jgi:hypothetical protein
MIREPLLNSLSHGYEFMYPDKNREETYRKDSASQFCRSLGLLVSTAFRMFSRAYPGEIKLSMKVQSTIDDRLCIASHHQCCRMNHIFAGALH